MRELERLVRTFCSHSHKSWARYIEKVSDCLNFLVHKSTEYTPFSFHYGKDCEENIYEIFQCLRNKKEGRKFQLEVANKNLLKSFLHRAKYQGSVSKVPLQVRDLVLLRVPHLSDKSQKCIYKFFNYNLP